jgi:trimethylamine:corrinoid methyltransferase-like protein
VALAQALLAEEHLLTHPHTAAHWPEALYLPGPVWERQTREEWVKGGRPSLRKRAQAAVERGLGGYTEVETDPATHQ